MRDLRALLSDQGAVQANVLSDHEVIQQVGHLVRQGRLVLSTGEAVAAPGDASQGSGGAAQSTAPEQKKNEAEPTDSAPPPPPTTEPQKSWVKFAVVDEVTGQPVAGVTLKIKLPTGEVQTFTTNGAGLVYIGNIDPGSCEIVAMSDDSAFEVVDVAASNF